MSRRASMGGRALLCLLLLGSSLLSAQTVRPIDKKGLDSLIQQRNGKVLLLNIWATWCIPCREEFPDLVKLQKEMKATTMDAEVVAVSVDFPDEITSSILPFVKKMKANFPVFVSDLPSQDEFIGAFDPAWSGAVPATFVYDTAGKQRAFLLGKRSYDQLKKAVDDVLSKP